MNCTASRKDLLSLTQRAAAVADARSTMLILHNLLLQASGQSLTVSGTDLFRSLTGRVDATVAKAGAICVDAKALHERIKAMPDGPIALAVSSNSLVIKTQGSSRKYTLRTVAADDYPTIPQVGDAPTLTIDPVVLSGLIRRSVYAVAVDDTRAHINVLLLEWDGETVRAVATDGHRMALAAHRSGGQHASESMRIPLKALHELRKLTDDLAALPEGERSPLTIARNGPNVFFLAGPTLRLGAKLGEQDFPPWKNVVPTSSALTVRVSRERLLDAVRAMSVAASDKTSGVRLAFNKGTLSVSAESPERGDGIDELPYDVASGKDGALVGMNARYIIDVLSSLASEEVTLGLGAELEPLVVRPVGDADGEFVGVLMPMRLS